ncbi:hypothetical protein GGI35DRAFT_493061 [Trichoderma velutinum]
MFFTKSQKGYRALLDKDTSTGFTIDDQNRSSSSPARPTEKDEDQGLDKLYISNNLGENTPWSKSSHVQYAKPVRPERLRMYQALSVSLLIAQIFIVSLLLWVVHLYRNSVSSGCQYESPRISIKGIANIPVEMEMRQLHTAVRYGDVTPFMGGWNNETNHAWESILDAGLIRLTPDQASKLPYKTAKNPHDPSTYVGILEVFHQLHCLNYIRHGYYIPEQRDLYPDPGKDATHADHCFDFLRQNLMCWSDTDIASISWDSKENVYVPEHDPIKRCANFDLIHQWAKRKENWVPN